MVYTPQQNGRIERKHRHLLDTARAIRLHANLPIKFWGDCILVATYLINKMHVEALGWKSPYEKLFGKPPLYDHLRVIGCLCYAAETFPHRDKFDNRGIKCVLLGYPLNQKGYRLYNLESGETFNNRDVVFKENVFPFKNYNNNAPSMPKPDFPTFGDEENEENPTLFTASIPTDVNPNTPNSSSPSPIINDPVLSSSSSIPINIDPLEQVRRYKQAVQYTGWRQTMDKELVALEKNNTWTLTVLPPGHKPISSKWVYKTKYNPDGIVERLKARLVVRGFNQQEGLDYKHTFSPVAKLATVRVPIAIATAKQWPLHQLNINNAFLHVYIDEEIYMTPPEGYTKAAPGQFLGIEICNTANGTHLNQRKYILDLLTDAGLTSAKPNLSPLPTNLKLSLDMGSPLPDLATYRRLVGRLLYLTMTRPDISYVVQHLSQFVSSPKYVHLQSAIHLLKYLKGSISKGLFYPVQPHLKVTCFSDADWASCLMTRKSLTGYCIFLGHSLVSWKIKKQAAVSRSSTEAEYGSMTTTTCEILWLSFLLKDLHILVKLPIILFCDNKPA
ncbi:retrovirus-related pol polyprotein from transposon TNT 1-94 [Tanacetum coccineum]